MPFGKRVGWPHAGLCSIECKPFLLYLPHDNEALQCRGLKTRKINDRLFLLILLVISILTIGLSTENITKLFI